MPSYDPQPKPEPRQRVPARLTAGGLVPLAVASALGASSDAAALDASGGGPLSANTLAADSLVVQHQLSAARIQVGPTADREGNNPIYSYIPEAVPSPPNVFGPSHVFVLNRQPGGSGNREAIHVEANVNGGAVGEQIVGGMLRGAIISGAGTAYGVNPYCLVNAGVDAGSQCVGSETDVDARQDLAAKVGIQVVDVGTSVGRGTAIDTAYLAGTQLGGAGFARGFQFGYSDQPGATDFEGQYPVRPGGTLIYSIPTARVLRAGLDLSKLVHPTSDAALKLPIGDRIRFGDNGAGGTVWSLTNINAGSFLFGANLSVIDFGGQQQHKFTPTGYTTSGIVEARAGLRTTEIGSGVRNVGVLTGSFARPTDPTTADIPAGRCADWHNTAANTYRHVCNFGGRLRGIAFE